jgi:hypothetical protein
MAFLNDHEIIVPASGEKYIPAYGSMLVCKEASAGFDVKFDEGPKNFCEGGYGIFTGDKFFRGFTLFNRNASALVLSLRSGDGGGKSGVVYDYLRTRSTKIRPSGLITIANGAGQAFAGVAVQADLDSYGIPVGARRKHAIISAGGELILTKGTAYSAANGFGKAYTDQPRIVEGDEPFFLQNISGADVNLRVEEHFYV